MICVTPITADMLALAQQLLAKSKEIEPSFQKIINDNWDLL